MVKNAAIYCPALGITKGMATPPGPDLALASLLPIAGKVVRHAGRVYLKVREPVVELFESIRAQGWQLALEGET